MALRFFWRCESTTLDGTDDYSSGDTSGTGNSGCVTDSTVSVVSGNSVYVVGGGDNIQFDNTGIHDDLDSVGSCAFSVKITANPSGDSECGIKMRGSSTTTANQTTQIIRGSFSTNAGAIRFRHAGTTLSPAGAGAALSSNTTYGVVCRWDQPNSLRRLEIYDASGTLIEAVENTSGFTAPSWDAFSTGLRIGEDSGFTLTCGIDNVFIADAYDEPLEDYLDITSYTEYGGAAASAPKRSLLLGIG